MDKIVLALARGVSAIRLQISWERSEDFVLQETLSNSFPDAFLSIAELQLRERFSEREFKLAGTLACR